MQSGCAWYPWTCGDSAGGWFFWALRDTAAQEGHYETPAATGEFFGRLRDQVVTACHQGFLACDNWKLGQTLHLNVEQISQIPNSRRVAYPAIRDSAVGRRRSIQRASGRGDKELAFPQPPGSSVRMAGHLGPRATRKIFRRRAELVTPSHRRDRRAASPGSCVGQFDAVSHEVVGGGAPVNGWAWSLGEKIAAQTHRARRPFRIIVGLGIGRVAPSRRGGGARRDCRQRYGLAGLFEGRSFGSAYAIVNSVSNRCRLTGTLDIVAQPIADRELDPLSKRG